MNHRIELSHVTKRFGQATVAVDDVSFKLSDGEILALLGPSGCGKTTTLRLVAGFEWPDAGTIAIGGKMVAGGGFSVGPEKRGIGMVFQDYPLLPHRTVAQNVAFGLHRVGRREAERRVAELLERMGLGGLGGRYPHELSGGQQQRVALAQALAPKPNVILLDEPFSNLDASLRHDLRIEVRQVLKEHKATAILVTHDQKEAFSVADTVAVMNAGRIEQIGTPYELYSRPKSAFVARFLGHSALLEGVVGENGGPEIITDLGAVPCGLTLASAGERVTVSLRPDSLIVDPNGTFVGQVERVVHEGPSVEVAVRMPCGSGSVVLRTHVTPELGVEQGDVLRFSIAPERVAVIR